MQALIENFVSEKARRLVSFSVEQGEHLLITGPRGSGKTELALWAARQCGRPSEVCHLGACTDVEATLQGTMRLEKSATIFTRARFADAVGVPFAVVILEEINRSGDSKTQGVLLPCMDGQKRLFLDQEKPGRRVVDVAEGVVIIGTANQGAQYSGTEPLDAALLDRMLKLQLDYSDCEADVLRGRGLNDKQVKNVMRIAKEVRKQSASGVLTSSISTRGLDKVAKLLEGGFSYFDAFEAVVGVWDEEAAAALRTIVRVVGQ